MASNNSGDDEPVITKRPGDLPPASAATRKAENKFGK